MARLQAKLVSYQFNPRVQGRLILTTIRVQFCQKLLRPLLLCPQSQKLECQWVVAIMWLCSPTSTSASFPGLRLTVWEESKIGALNNFTNTNKSVKNFMCLMMNDMSKDIKAMAKHCQVHLLLHYKPWRVYGSLQTAKSFVTHVI